MLSNVNTETQSLYSYLKTVAKKGQFIFGQQKATLVGIGEEGNSPWGDSDYGNRTDVEAYAGQKVGMIGIDVWDLAAKNPTWNQPVYSKAIRDFYNSGSGGAVTLDWHMRGCSVKPVKDGAGNEGIPGDGFKVNDWENDPNSDCLCKIVNEEPWENGLTWKDWFLSQKLDKFHQKLVQESLTGIPIIYRPFHEQTGSWFWWGAKGWDCERQLGKSNVVKGAEAYKKLFRMTVDYLRKTKGLKNLLIAFAPDKLCKHDGHTCSSQNAMKDTPTSEELRNDYLNSYPGDEYVDILGIDLYYSQKFGNPWEEADYQTRLFTQYLRVVSTIADEKSKVAALTETGNYNLHNESSTGSQWYTKQLLAMLSDPEVKVAYVLTWENRKLDSTEYYIPHKKHADYQDFVRFSESASTLFYNDLSEMYKTAAPNPEERPEAGVYPACLSKDSDPDGDGWGWENGRSCQWRDVSFATCTSVSVDSDGDGWGWENNQTCRVRLESYPRCGSPSSDPDGDGWGWENGRACQSNANAFPTCSNLSTDPDGDGWGFENSQSCRVRLESYPKCRQNSSGRGDGWGWENGQSCRQ
ncbi:glycosyl hydrolase [Oligoflexus tunisiensis]|uniref:glycosyl hydrolase n=1 Tax=Oligoflexus tunisiensis TaxID=708132 RepID=UPI00159F018D|nr:glycosyl hydrolase [Oligoflexus tunisiensis]